MLGPITITLTTDFGLEDPYVGAMKGVILSINPRCRMIDITHQVPPQDILAGGLALSAAYRYFPAGTVHLAVVDPGVGPSRKPILIETERYFFIGPDNGIFSFVLSRETVKQMVELTDSSYFLSSPSATFHGRDIFAPAAAHLSKGTPTACFGRTVSVCERLALPEPVPAGQNSVQGEVLHIDRFGNLITSLTRPFVEKRFRGAKLRAEILNREIHRFLKTYAQARSRAPFCLFGSSDYLEVSVKNGSAAQVLSAVRGDKIRVWGIKGQSPGAND